MLITHAILSYFTAIKLVPLIVHLNHFKKYRYFVLTFNFDLITFILNLRDYVKHRSSKYLPIYLIRVINHFLTYPYSGYFQQPTLLIHIAKVFAKKVYQHCKPAMLY